MKAFIIFVLFLLCSCTTTKYVEVPIEKVRVEYIDKIKYDSIYTYDSVFIKSKGDTIYLDKYRYLYKYKFIRDTINIKDTITVSKPIEVEKEVNRVYTWQIILMVIGGGSLGIYLYRLFRNIKI